MPNQGDSGVPKLSGNAITAHLAATFADLPVYVHTIEHAEGVVLVDTGMLDSTPELDEEGAPVPMPENIPRDVVCVINTHLHFDHCGGNRLFPGVPIHVQRLELQGPHDPHEWVHFPGATYVEHDGEAEVLPGIRLLPTPGHTNGHQSVLVDTGMLDSTPELDEEGAAVPMPENIPREVVCVINTHLHFDHCGGNRLFPGVPIHVQRLELQGPHDPPEWVDFPGATYAEHDGEAEVLPGIRLLPTPGHTPGHQSVLVDTPDGLVVIGGDVAYSFHELGSGTTEGQRRVLALAAPTWLTHTAKGPRVPRPNEDRGSSTDARRKGSTG